MSESLQKARGPWTAEPIDPTISVIIPTYNRSAFLLDALRSVADQTYKAVEVIVVDDCSPEPLALPAVSGLNVKVLRHSRNQGAAAARNTGFAHSTGDWVLFLDDDDLLTPNRLAHAVQGMGNAHFHAARMECFEPDGTVQQVTTKYDGDLRGVFLDGSHPFGRQPIFGQVVMRREDFIQFNPTLRRAEDSEWWLRQTDRAIFSWTDEVGLRVRLHEEVRNYTYLSDYFMIRRHLAQTYGPKSSARRRASLYSKAAGAAINGGHRGQAVVWSVRSLFARPTPHALRQLAKACLTRLFGKAE